MVNGEQPKAARLAARGVRSGVDFADLMTALMDDVLSSRVTPQQGGVAVGAASNLLKMVEMTYRFGRVNTPDGVPQLDFAPNQRPEERDARKPEEA